MITFDFISEPSQPQNVGISQIQARQVFVQWEEPDDKNGPIDQYVLTAKSDNQVNIYCKSLLTCSLV